MLIQAWKYESAGRQIFTLNGELIDMFLNTSADSIPLSELVCPYQYFYIHFGSQEAMQVAPGWCVDGVYVEHYPDVPLMSFTFTAIPDEEHQVLCWDHVREPTLKLTFTADMFDMNIGDALERAVEELRQTIEEKIERGDTDYSQHMKDVAVEQGLPVLSNEVVERSETVGRLELEIHERETAIATSAMNLVVNALCYMTAYSDDITQQWPKSAPESLKDKARSGPPKQRRRSVAKLTALGYVKVHYCGDHSVKVSSTDNSGASKRSHWRKGHWRSQRHGPGRSLRRLALIKPVLVNADDPSSEELQGHIYIGRNMPADNDFVH